jgi:6-phosphogluconolactonase
MSIEPRRFGSRAELTAALASRIESVLGAARASPMPLGLMLAGGSTPLPAYREVAQHAPAPAPMLRVLYSDDRHVPATSDASNYHQTQALITALALPASSVLRVRTELPLAAAAEDYGKQLGELLASGARIPLGLLGLGADGHTASLFRAAHIEEARGKLAIAVQRPDGLAGVSATPELLARVEELLFVVAGSGKHDALQAFLRQDSACVAWAAVQAAPKVTLWLDPEAAAGLSV